MPCARRDGVLAPSHNLPGWTGESGATDGALTCAVRRESFTEVLSESPSTVGLVVDLRYVTPSYRGVEIMFVELRRTLGATYSSADGRGTSKQGA